MYFRRDLDFDDLIETIDQLADEEIDEVVDWQLTDSPAAKTENPAAPGGGRLGSVPGAAWVDVAGGSGGGGGRSPQWVQRLQEATTGYTMEQLMELRNRAWQSGDRDAALGIEARIQERDQPRTRTYVQLSGNFVIAPPPSEPPLWGANPLQDGSQFTFGRIRYRTVSYDVMTRVEPAMDVIHVRLGWGEVGCERRYQQTAASMEAVRALRAPMGILRADITPERRLGVELDPRRSDNIGVFMESA